MIKKIVVLVLLLALFLGMLVAARNIMPIWQWLLPSSLLISTVYFFWNFFHRIGALFVGTILALLLAFSTFSFEEGEPIVVYNKQGTYVVYNNCFLYCRPTVYKKYPYLPFTKKHQRLGEHAVRDYRVSEDTIYLKDQLREWALVE